MYSSDQMRYGQRKESGQGNISLKEMNRFNYLEQTVQILRKDGMQKRGTDLKRPHSVMSSKGSHDFFSQLNDESP